jgi:hypothetical protein
MSRSRALLNADVMVRKSWALSDVPVMSLMYARSIPGGVPALQQIINALVTSTTFCILDGSGKDFERVCDWNDAHTSALAARSANHRRC